jgi:capsular exopolysaccharide synthesis family protein
LVNQPQTNAPLTRDTGDIHATGQGNDSGGLNLRDLWRALRRRRRLVAVAGGAIFSLAFASTLYHRITQPVYSGGFQLLISDPISANGTSSRDSDGLGGGVVENLARNRTSVDIPTLIQTLSSPLVLDPVRRQLGSAAPALRTLAITQPGDGRRGSQVDGVLVITLKGKVPSQIERSLNALSQTYLRFALAQRRERLVEGLRFLSEQEPVLEGKVNKLQADLAAFRQRHNLLAPEEQAIAVKTEQAAMEAQRRQMVADRARLLRLRQDIAAGRLTAANFSTGGGSSPSSSTTPGTSGSSDGVSVTQARSDLLDQLQSVEQQLAQARATYRGDAPRVQNLVALRNRLASQRRGQQLEAVDTALSLNATRAAVLGQQIQQLATQFRSQPKLIKEYEELQARLKVAQDNLASLLSTRSTFQLEQAQNTTPWKVIAPPSVATAPEEPSLRRGLLQALLLGAAAGVGAGLLRDRLDHVFHNPSEVKDELQEPLLGHIPHVAFFKGVREDKRFLIDELERSSSDKSDDRLSGYQRFFYQEAFRNLFTSLRFLNSGQPLRSVALTSSLPAEGKSLINVLLAKTISEMGQRVLLVDADLRKPQIHHRLGVNNLTGLSNLLTEDDLHWQDVIQPVANHEGWSVLTAGRRPPDPARLLSSHRMHSLVHQLADSGQFDLILYDTPPVLGLADAALVAEHLDGLMLLVSLDRVDRGLPRESIARIRSSGAALLGIVTNAVKEEKASSSAYGYGYGGYGYGGYGYGGYGYGGYGYGAYDPRTTYAYYQDQDATSAEQPEPAPSKTRPLKDLHRRLMRWIDG